MIRILALGLAVMMAGPAFAQGKPPASGAPAGQPALSIRNGTPHVINNVYLSLSSQQNWGRDQLGEAETLRAGATRAFTLPPGECLYDIRIVYQGNILEERRRIDACAEQSLELPLAAQRLPR
jgi:hypothetical protein